MHRTSKSVAFIVIVLLIVVVVSDIVVALIIIIIVAIATVIIVVIAVAVAIPDDAFLIIINLAANAIEVISMFSHTFNRWFLLTSASLVLCQLDSC